MDRGSSSSSSDDDKNDMILRPDDPFSWDQGAFLLLSMLVFRPETGMTMTGDNGNNDDDGGDDVDDGDESWDGCGDESGGGWVMVSFEVLLQS